jgi:hypothetical protein
LGFSKVAFYPQNLKKKRNYADKSHFWLKNLIFVEKPSNVNTFRTITLFSWNIFPHQSTLIKYNP